MLQKHADDTKQTLGLTTAETIGVASGIYYGAEMLRPLGFDYEDSVYITQEGEDKSIKGWSVVTWPEPEPQYVSNLVHPYFQTTWGDRQDNIIIEAVQKVEFGHSMRSGRHPSEGRLTLIYPNLMVGVPKEMRQVIDAMNQKTNHTNVSLLEYEGQTYGVQMTTKMKDRPLFRKPVQDSKNDTVLAFDSNQPHDFTDRFCQVINDYMPDLCQLQEIGKGLDCATHDRLISDARHLWASDSQRYLNPETNSLTSDYIPVEELNYYADALQSTVKSDSTPWLNLSDLSDNEALAQ